MIPSPFNPRSASSCELHVDVLLATYNGGQFLAAQIESVLRQKTEARLRILIGDDGSSDETLQIIANFCATYPDQVFFLGKGPGRGAAANFARLLEASTADYIFLCDQDDVWDVDKVALALRQMRAAELEYGGASPLLVFSDLRVVDRNLKLLANSFWAYQNIDGRAVSLISLAMQNVVTGCTCLLNRSLVCRALPLPDTALMHDHWLALVAAATGRLLVLPRATVSYRQHGGNEVGARAWSFRYILHRAVQLVDRRHAAEALMLGHAQLRSLAERYGCDLEACRAEELEAYLSLPGLSPFARVRLVCRSGWFRQSTIRTIGWFWLLLWAKTVQR